MSIEELNQMEPFYPLHVYVCLRCFLVQLQEYVRPPEIFVEYPYFSSYSTSWLAHAETYVSMMIDRFSLGPRTQVVELGSNDGYLLQYFVSRGVPALGIEPAANVAEEAIKRGVPTRVAFFGEETARSLVADGTGADLVVGNNVLSQVPDLNSFVEGVRLLLEPTGLATFEFPHLERLIEQNQFDTIYHEHFSYFSFTTVGMILAAHGLTIFDVEQLPTHGGSLRIYVRHAEQDSLPVQPSVPRLAQRERASGVERIEYYEGFGRRVASTKRKLLRFLIDAQESGESVAGYGAPGKANTLLNYCGVHTDLLKYTVDRNPLKQGRFLPGTHIPIFAPERIQQTKPDYLMILPWNLKDEIMQQMGNIREWGGRFIVPIPEVRIYE